MELNFSIFKLKKVPKKEKKNIPQAAAIVWRAFAHSYGSAGHRTSRPRSSKHCTRTDRPFS